MNQNTKIFASLVALLLLTLADILTTLFFLSLPPVEVNTPSGTMVYSGVEYNGLIWHLVSSNSVLFVCVKTILIGAVALFLYQYYHNLDNPHKQGTIYGAVLALCAMYLVVVFNNIQIITFLLSHLK